MTRRNTTSALFVAVATLAAPSIGSATVTSVTIRPNNSPGGCADVTAATSSINAQYQLPGGARVAAVTGRPVAATACAGGAGRSITFDVEGNPDFAGTDFTIRGDDEATARTVHIPIARREGTTARFRELKPGSTVGGVLVPGDSYDISPVPTPTVVSTVGGATATVVLSSVPEVFFYFNADATASSIQVNGPAPNAPIQVELRRPDGTLALARTLPAPIPAAVPSANIFGAPGLPPGSTARVVQGPYLDRTRAAPIAEFRADGFRVALPADASEGRFSHQIALSPASRNPLDPLGPCETLQTSGTLPTPSCTGLTTPRVEVAATGLLPIAGDSVSVSSSFPGSGDVAGYFAVQAGISADMDGGRIEPVVPSTSTFDGTLTVPRPAPLGPLTFTRRGVVANRGEGGDGAFSGPNSFPVRIPSGSRLRLDGPAVTPALDVVLSLEVSVANGSVQGTALPGARVRVTSGDPRNPYVDAVVAAGPSGAFAVPLGTTPTGADIEVVSGDATRTAVRRRLVLGTPPIGITGATDRQLVRGAVSLAASSAVVVPIWLLGTQEVPLPGATLAIDSTRHQDGPLRVALTDNFRRLDYLFLIVDNTGPTGGAGADQRVRPGREATFITAAADANGLASVRMDFGDGSSLNQAADDLGQPITHRYARAGRYVARATITDRAGNVTRDDAVVTVAAAVAPRLSGTPPTQVTRGKRLRITQTASVTGIFNVQLVNAKGRIAARGAAPATRVKGPVTATLATRRLARGRYLLVRQLVSGDGDVGPLLTSTLVVR